MIPGLWGNQNRYAPNSAALYRLGWAKKSIMNDSQGELGVLNCIVPGTLFLGFVGGGGSSDTVTEIRVGPYRALLLGQSTSGSGGPAGFAIAHIAKAGRYPVYLSYSGTKGRAGVYGWLQAHRFVLPFPIAGSNTPLVIASRAASTSVTLSPSGAQAGYRGLIVGVTTGTAIDLGGEAAGAVVDVQTDFSSDCVISGEFIYKTAGNVTVLGTSAVSGAIVCIPRSIPIRSIRDYH